jgi:hypothetical protein
VPQVRLSVPGTKTIFFECFQLDDSAAPNGFQLDGQFKAIVGFARLIRPRYALANLGHPSSSYWVRLADRLLLS